MSKQLTPKEQAEEILKRFSSVNIAGKPILYTKKEVLELANISVSALIAEQTFCPQTEHSKERKQFWEQVKKELNHE